MITYMTLPGDTLEKIASDLKVENPDYLRKFHNKHCAVYDRLVEPIKLKSGTLLLIPFGEEISKLNKEINENGDSLYFHPPQGKITFPIPLLSGIYNIRHQKLQDGEILSSYQYETELKYLRAEKDDHFLSLQIFGSRKDGMQSDSKVSSLAKACAALLFPVEIKVNTTGKLTDVKFFHSESVIKNELEALKKYFTDDLSAAYVDQMKAKIENNDHIISSIQHTLPVQFLFGSFYRAKYKNWTDSEAYQEFLPWLSNASPIRFELYNRIFPKDQNSNDDALKITQTGTSCDYRDLNQLYDKNHDYYEESLARNNPIICRHEAEYIFDRTNLMIQKVTGNFELQIGDVTENEVFIMEKQLK